MDDANPLSQTVLSKILTAKDIFEPVYSKADQFTHVACYGALAMGFEKAYVILFVIGLIGWAVYHE